MKHSSVVPIFLFAALLAQCGQSVRPTTDSSVPDDSASSSPCIAGWKVVERAIPIATPGNALVRAVHARRARDTDPFVRQIVWVDGPQPVPGRTQQIILSRYDGAGRLDRDDRAVFTMAGISDEGGASVITADQDLGVTTAAIATAGCPLNEWSPGLALSTTRSISMPPCFAIWGEQFSRSLLVEVRAVETRLELQHFSTGFDAPRTREASVALPPNEQVNNGWVSASRQSTLYFAYRTPSNAVRALLFRSPNTTALLSLNSPNITAMAAAADDNAGWFVLAPRSGPLELARVDAQSTMVRSAPLTVTANAGLLVSAAVSAIELLVAYFEGDGALRVAVVDLPSMQVRGVLPVSESRTAFGPKITAVGERDALIVHNVPSGASGRMAATTLTRCSN